MTFSSVPGSLRDGQVRSAFTEILEWLLGASVGSIAAVLVDEEGEAVDVAGAMSAFNIKIAAAHWQIVLRNLREQPQLGRSHTILVRTDRHGYLVYQLFGGYVLVAIGRPDQTFGISFRALQEAKRALAVEAGFAAEAITTAPWYRAYVTLGSDGLPVRMIRRSHLPESLRTVGPMERAGEFERSCLVRTASHKLFDLVRERSGVWYALDRSLSAVADRSETP